MTRPLVVSPTLFRIIGERFGNTDGFVATQLLGQRCDEEEPYWPTMYLGPQTLQILLPYIGQAIRDDMLGGQVLAELTNLANQTRAVLQHHDIWIEWE